MADELQPPTAEEIAAWRAREARRFNFGKKLKKMWETSPKAMVLFGAMCVLGGMIFGGMQGDGPAKLIHFAQKSAVFGLQAIIITLMSLGVVYISQLIRNMKWFDKRGASREMKKIQDRAGTTNEKPGDPIALGIQVTGTTLLIGIVILAYFLIHKP